MRLLPAGGGWVPVYLELRNRAGAVETVLIEGSVRRGGTTNTCVARQRVEVAPGAPRRCWLYLRVGPGGSWLQEARVEVRSAAGAPVYRGNPWPLMSIERNNPKLSLLIAGDEQLEVRPWTKPLTWAPASNRAQTEDVQESVDAVKSEQLPDSVLGYQCHDVVVLRGLEGIGLEPAQRDALRNWVFLGGHLILSPRKRSAAVFDSEIARELLDGKISTPVLVSGFVPGSLVAVSVDERGGPRVLFTTPSLTGANNGTGGADGADGAEAGEAETAVAPAYDVLDPLVGKAPREILAHPSGPAGTAERIQLRRRLYAEFPYGAGAVGVLTIDDQQNRSPTTAGFVQALWLQIAQWALRGDDDSFLDKSAVIQSAALAEALKDPSREVGVRVIVGLVAVYVALVGPGLYLFLRWRRRLPAVIWVEPLLVAAYLGVIFATGYITKGVLTKTRFISCTTQRAGDRLALRQSFLSIFSAGEAVYEVSSPKDSFLLRPIYKNAEEERLMDVRLGARGEWTLAGQTLAHWQEGSFASAAVIDLEGPGLVVRDSAAGPGGALRVSVENRLPHAVREGVIFQGQRRYALPPIAPGRTVEVDLVKPIDETSQEKRLSRLLEKGLRVQNPRVLAVLDRSDEDFTIDQRTSLKERLDCFLLLP